VGEKSSNILQNPVLSGAAWSPSTFFYAAICVILFFVIEVKLKDDWHIFGVILCPPVMFLESYRKEETIDDLWNIVSIVMGCGK